MRNEKADVVIVIVAVLALFLSPRILAAGSSQQRSDLVVKYKTDHYEIVTDVSLELAKKVGNNVEAVLKEYSRVLPLSEDGLPSTVFRVRLFLRKEDFQEYCRESLGYTYDRKTFLYNFHSRNVQDREVVCFVLPEIPFFTRLRHEVFHQYFRHFIHYPPQWLNEGLAELFEVSPITEQGRMA